MGEKVYLKVREKNMKKNDYKTVVIFRVWKDINSVIALFPFVNYDVSGLYCESYEHIGQHGYVDYNYVSSRTRLAKSSEYTNLKEELEGLGYDLVVKSRRSYGR